jgi:uncharacterized membrane protein required for colicin V production
MLLWSFTEGVIITPVVSEIFGLITGILSMGAFVALSVAEVVAEPLQENRELIVSSMIITLARLFVLLMIIIYKVAISNNYNCFV